MQAYLAGGAGGRGRCWPCADLDWRDSERLRFVLTNLIAAAAPSNNPLLNPVGRQGSCWTPAAVSAVRGLRALPTDLAAAPRVPSMVEPDAFDGRPATWR